MHLCMYEFNQDSMRLLLSYTLPKRTASSSWKARACLVAGLPMNRTKKILIYTAPFPSALSLHPGKRGLVRSLAYRWTVQKNYVLLLFLFFQWFLFVFSTLAWHCLFLLVRRPRVWLVDYLCWEPSHDTESYVYWEDEEQTLHDVLLGIKRRNLRGCVMYVFTCVFYVCVCVCVCGRMNSKLCMMYCLESSAGTCVGVSYACTCICICICRCIFV